MADINLLLQTQICFAALTPSVGRKWSRDDDRSGACVGFGTEWYYSFSKLYQLQLIQNAVIHSLITLYHFYFICQFIILDKFGDSRDEIAKKHDVELS
jgi:hypothetical protein